jgi:trehalose 6-phosphate synthase
MSSSIETDRRLYCDLTNSEVLANRSLIIASNRGPMTFELAEDGNLQTQRNGGGLVTALLGLCELTPAAWIACSASDADANWSEGDLFLADSGRPLHMRFLTPAPEVYDGYYNIIANPLLWFLQHSMWDVPRAPVIGRAIWEAWRLGYVEVNEQFARAIANRVRSGGARALVMLQDYHLYLAPRFLRSRLRGKLRPAILHFTHIPWPGPDYWRILPPTMRRAILDGMCASDILGFQTKQDVYNFMRTCEAVLPGAHVNFKRGAVWFRNHSTHVCDFPISIDVYSLRQTAASAEVEAHRASLEEMIDGRRLILRIDRMDPSKNIIRGFQAFEEFLAHHPEHLKQVTFIAILVPSRLGVDEYQTYLDDLMAAAGRVTARFGTSDWEPVRLLVGDDYARAVAALKLYDVLLVNPIADGMNLVAKEGPIVNERDGVLILSERAGAREQVESGATVISPCDIYATAEAIHQGLNMSGAERADRSARLRWIVEREDIRDWLCKQLRTVKELNL